jgi:hypothetical protein
MWIGIHGRTVSNRKLNDLYKNTLQNLSEGGKLVEDKQRVSKNKCGMCKSMDVDSQSRSCKDKCQVTPLHSIKSYVGVEI